MTAFLVGSHARTRWNLELKNISGVDHTAITAMLEKASWGGASCLAGGRSRQLTGQRHVDGRSGDILLLAQVHIPAWLVAQVLGIPVTFPAKTQVQVSQTLEGAQRAQPELWEAG